MANLLLVSKVRKEFNRSGIVPGICALVQAADGQLGEFRGISVGTDGRGNPYITVLVWEDYAKRPEALGGKGPVKMPGAFHSYTLGTDVPIRYQSEMKHTAAQMAENVRLQEEAVRKNRM